MKKVIAHFNNGMSQVFSKVNDVVYGDDAVNLELDGKTVLIPYSNIQYLEIER